MQRDGLMDESDNFLPRFGNGPAAGKVGHVSAVITFSFLDDHYVLHLFKSLFLKPYPGRTRPEPTAAPVMPEGACPE